MRTADPPPRADEWDRLRDHLAQGQTPRRGLAGKRDEQDFYVHAYELALGSKKEAIEALERGESTREAAKIGGISNGTAAALARGAQKSSFLSTEPKADVISPPEVATLPLATPER
jgi:hypothetical protein